MTRSIVPALAVLLLSGVSGQARAAGYLRRLQPSKLPPLPAPASKPAAPERPPKGLPVTPIVPAPVVTMSSPYAAGVRRLVEPGGEVSDVAIHPGGALMAAASSDRRVHLWDLSARTHVALPLPGGEGQHVRFSPDGRWLAAIGIGVSSGVTIFPITGGGLQPSFQLAGGGGFDEQVAFSPDGRRMAVDGWEKVLIYDIPVEGRPATEHSLELPSATSSFVRASFSRDGKHLVVLSHEGKVTSWRTDTWERLGVWEIPTAEYSAGRPHGVVMREEPGKAWVLTTEQLISLDYTTGSWGRSWHELGGYSLARRPGGQSLVVGQIDGSVLLVDPRSGGKLLRLEGHRELVEATAFFPDGRLVTGSEDGTLVIWEMLPDRDLTVRGPDGPLARVQYPFRASVPRRGQGSPRLAVSDLPERPSAASTDGVGACFSPDGKVLASGYSGKLRLHHAGHDEVFRTIDRLSGQGHVTAWFPGSDRVATIDREFVRVYRVATGDEVAAWSAGSGWDYHLAVSPDGTRLARAGTRDVAVHDTATGKLVAEFEALGKVEEVSSPRLHDLAFSPDGTRLLTGGDDGVLRLWQVDSQRLVAEARDAHHPSVRAARFLPDGTVISLGQDGVLRWWGRDLKPGRREEGHLGEGRSLALYPRASLILSGGRDGAVIFWGFDGTKRLRLDTDLESIDYLAPSPTGEWLVVASEADGSLRLPLALLVTQLKR